MQQCEDETSPLSKAVTETEKDEDQMTMSPCSRSLLQPSYFLTSCLILSALTRYTSLRHLLGIWPPLLHPT